MCVYTLYDCILYRYTHSLLTVDYCIVIGNGQSQSTGRDASNHVRGQNIPSAIPVIELLSNDSMIVFALK